MMHDAMMGGKGPPDHGGSPASLWLFVEDCDALFNRAVTAGGKVLYPLADQFCQELDERAARFFAEMASGKPK